MDAHVFDGEPVITRPREGRCVIVGESDHQIHAGRLAGRYEVWGFASVRGHGQVPTQCLHPLGQPRIPLDKAVGVLCQAGA